MPFDDINAFLGNSPRTDLIGPEMWTVCSGSATPENDGQAFIGGQMPFHSWSVPQLGLNGHLHITHATELHHVIQVEVSEYDRQNRASLRLIPTRNLWTPATLTTYYRSVNNSLGTDYPRSGACGVKETKCITSDNVFVAELEIGNYSPVPRTYEVKVFTALPGLNKSAVDGLSTLAGPIRFTTEAQAIKTPRTSFAALALTAPDFIWRLELAPWEKQTFRYGFSVEAQSAAALDKLKTTIADDAIFARNVAHFNDWFRHNVPALQLRNFDLLKMYYYRWFVVYRSMHEPRRSIPDHDYPRPVMYESPMGGWYDCVIGLSVPLQIQEAAWMRDPSPVWNHILNWAAKVSGYREHGYIQYTPMAVWKAYKCHADKDKLAQCFDALKAYSLENVGHRFDQLPVQVGSWGTGAEYQPNFYQFTTPPWDYRNDCELQNSTPGLHLATLIRLDTAGYAIGNLQAVGCIAGALSRPDDQKTFSQAADRMLDIVRKNHWSSELGLFLAADPVSGKLADQAACYDSFAPYMWGMIKDPAYLKAFDKLLDPAWFWDDFPISTTARNCPMYFDKSALVGPTNASLVKPHEYGCCWNGPAWNYTNSLIAESLGQGALGRKELRSGWLDFFTRWSDMQFLYGDRSVPYTSEHHRPGDGARLGGPSEYFHSSWIDPFISYWCGIRLDNDLQTLTFDPFSEESFSLAHVPLAGKEYTFEQKIDPSNHQRELIVSDADGHVVGRQTGGRPLILPRSD